MKFKALLNIGQRSMLGGNLGTITEGYIRHSVKNESVWMQFSLSNNLYLDDEAVPGTVYQEVFGLEKSVGNLELHINLDKVTLVDTDGDVVLEPNDSTYQEQLAVIQTLLQNKEVKGFEIEWECKLSFSYKSKTFMSQITGARLTQEAKITQATIKLVTERVELGGEIVEHEEIVEAVIEKMKDPKPKGLAGVKQRLSKETKPVTIFSKMVDTPENADNKTGANDLAGI